MSEDKIVYSVDGKIYDDDYCLFLDFINSYGKEGESVKAFKGIAVYPSNSDFFQIDGLVEDIQERARDNHGEFAEDYFLEGDEIKLSELDELISEFLDANFTKPTFYTVKDVEEFIIIVKK